MEFDLNVIDIFPSLLLQQECSNSDHEDVNISSVCLSDVCPNRGKLCCIECVTDKQLHIHDKQQIVSLQKLKKFFQQVKIEQNRIQSGQKPELSCFSSFFNDMLKEFEILQKNIKINLEKIKLFLNEQSEKNIQSQFFMMFENELQNNSSEYLQKKMNKYAVNLEIKDNNIQIKNPKMTNLIQQQGKQLIDKLKQIEQQSSILSQGLKSQIEASGYARNGIQKLKEEQLQKPQQQILSTEQVFQNNENQNQEWNFLGQNLQIKQTFSRFLRTAQLDQWDYYPGSYDGISFMFYSQDLQNLRMRSQNQNSNSSFYNSFQVQQALGNYTQSGQQQIENQQQQQLYIQSPHIQNENENIVILKGIQFNKITDWCDSEQVEINVRVCKGGDLNKNIEYQESFNILQNMESDLLDETRQCYHFMFSNMVPITENQKYSISTNYMQRFRSKQGTGKSIRIQQYIFKNIEKGIDGMINNGTDEYQGQLQTLFYSKVI